MKPARISPITAGRFIFDIRYPKIRADSKASAMRNAISYIVFINLLLHQSMDGIVWLRNIFELVDEV